MVAASAIGRRCHELGRVVALVAALASPAAATVPSGASSTPAPVATAPPAPLTLVETLRRAQVEIALATTAGAALDAAAADPDFPELAGEVSELAARREGATMALARAESKLLTASGMQSVDYAREALELASSARLGRERLAAELADARARRRQEVDRQVAILAPEARQVLLDTAALGGVEIAFQRSEQERLLGELEREGGLAARRRVLDELRRSTRFLRLVADAGPGAAAPSSGDAAATPPRSAPPRPETTASPAPTAAAASVPPPWREALESAVQAYLDGRYEAAATELAGLSEVAGRPGAVIQLFLAAARFQQAALAGDDAALAAAAAAARRATGLDPTLVPDPTWFSPRFTGFFLASR